MILGLSSLAKMGALTSVDRMSAGVFLPHVARHGSLHRRRQRLILSFFLEYRGGQYVAHSIYLLCNANSPKCLFITIS